jgi:hypothetical protein
MGNNRVETAHSLKVNQPSKGLIEPKASSLFAENRSIQQLKPTDLIQNKILLAIHSIFQRILQWFYPIAKTNFIGLTSALDEKSPPGVSALIDPFDEDDSISLLKKFFDKDVGADLSLKASLTEIEEQYEAITQFNMKKQSNFFGLTDEQKERILDDFRVPLFSWKARIENLKEGEQSVIVAEKNLFFLFSKKDGKLCLTVVGRGASMARLANADESAPKIVSRLHYGEVNASFLKDLLNTTPLGEQNKGSIESVLKGKAIHEVDQSKSMAAKTEGVFNAHWTLFSEIQKNQGKAPIDLERSKLRMEIFSLFSMLKECRHTLKSNLIELNTFDRLFHLCSEDIQAALTKGTLQKEEVELLVKELTRVEKAIAEAHEYRKQKISSIRAPAMNIYQLKPITDIRSPQLDVSPQVAPVANPRLPTLDAPKGKLESFLVRKKDDARKSLPINKQLQTLVDHPTHFSDLIEMIAQMKIESLGSLSNEEGKIAIDQLSTLSSRILEFVQEKKELPRELLSTLVKMTYMIAYLTHYKANGAQFSRESYYLFEAMGRFQPHSQGRSRFGEVLRFGHPLNNEEFSLGSKFLKEKEAFYKTFDEIEMGPNHTYQRNTLYKKPMPKLFNKGLFGENYSFSKPVDSLLPLQKQLDILNYLHNRGNNVDVYGWVDALPLSLLPLYRELNVNEGSNSWYGVWFAHDSSNRNVPEAIQHDPQSTLDQYKKKFFSSLNSEQSNLENKIKYKLSMFSYFSHYFDPVPPLQGSKFGEVERDKQRRDFISRMNTNVKKASQIDQDFSKAEQTALMSLLKGGGQSFVGLDAAPRQQGVLAFIEQQKEMLTNPAVRNFLELLFFSPGLLNSDLLYHKGMKEFYQYGPGFLAEKITEYKARVLKKPEEMDVLIFLVDFSEKLRVGLKNAESLQGKKAQEVKIGTFFDRDDPELLKLFQKTPKTTALVASQVKRFLAKDKLTQTELSSLIIDMQWLKSYASFHSSYHFHEFFFLEGSYEKLMLEVEKTLDTEHLAFVLDSICHQRSLPLDHSSWTGTFPIYSNAQYTIDLVRGTIADKASNAISSHLPIPLKTDPLFKESFPEFLTQDPKVMAMKSPDGLPIYFFKDGAKQQARVEEKKEGGYAYYRTFPKLGTLQAASFVKKVGENEIQSFLSELNGGGKKPGIVESVSKLWKLTKKDAELPAILKQPFFIDPKTPLKGYIISEDGEPELEVHLTAKNTISHVIDLRGYSASKPMRLVSLDQIGHPALKALAQIENADQILGWGDLKSGVIEKIELPRYGLKFVIQEGKCVCVEGKYAGYHIDLAASVPMRKGFQQSLLLQHSDPAKPKKLILPPADAISIKPEAKIPYSGPAFLIWAIRTAFDVLYKHKIPKGLVQLGFNIDEKKTSITPLEVEIAPLTDELLLEKAKPQELLRHALSLQNTALATQLIRSLEIKADDKEVGEWLQFVPLLKGLPHGIGLTLQLTGRIYEVIEGRSAFKEQLEALQSMEAGLIAEYKEQCSTLPKLYQIDLKAWEKRKDKGDKIELLEKTVQIQQAISRESLKKAVPLESQKTPLVKGLDRKKVYKELSEVKKEIQTLLSSKEPLELLSLYARDQKHAEMADLHLALLQNDFPSLAPRLPKGTDVELLKIKLIRYYDLEIQHHLLGRPEKETYIRQYDPKLQPELLAFEAFHFVTFRRYEQGGSQLQTLQELLQSPSSIIQAGTGSGKSSVLSVLRGLMRANGKNLVSQKVLPHLYDEALAILEERLGSAFRRKVYPFRFSLSMPTYDAKGNSVFEEIYHNLLDTIQNKGCVVTDYKSFVLLEQKFLALSVQLSADAESKIKSSDTIVKHWEFLAKILKLLKARNDELMDEFDQPMSAVQRIQTQIKEGELIEKWMVSEAISLYDFLRKDGDLFLEKNLQGDLSIEKRGALIKKAATHFANVKAKGDASVDLIYKYFTGQSEEVLKALSWWSEEEKDRLSFLKEEFLTYLPLTLARSGKSNYRRSDDGMGIKISAKGEPREAKFGNPIEELNYTIQEYTQNKVALPTFRAWMCEAKKDFFNEKEAAMKRFNDVIPGVSLGSIAHLTPDEFEDQVELLLKTVNQTPKIVEFFMRRHLEALRSSATVISMNPQDSVAMSLAVSGVSATTGSLGSLHDQFIRDEAVALKAQTEGISRVKKRSVGAPVRYNPHSPLAMLKQGPLKFSALIDGAGAFRDVDPAVVAKALLEANPALKQVRYYDVDKTVKILGERGVPLEAQGFYFPQAQTRGSDQLLAPNAIALMTASGAGGIEDFIQEEGRMRGANQKVLVALSEFAPKELKSLDELIEYKKETEKEAYQEDRYRSELQRLKSYVRTASREFLLQKTDSLENFLKEFDKVTKLFITPGAVKLEPGHYFAKHSTIVAKTQDPVAEIGAFQKGLLEECKGLNISCKALSEFNPEKLRAFLPKKVLPLQVAESNNQEVEEELEQEQSQEIDVEQELVKEIAVKPNKVDNYLARTTNKKTSLASQFHKAFSDKIHLTDPFLPLDRVEQKKVPAVKNNGGKIFTSFFKLQPNLLHKRSFADDRTGRVGVIEVVSTKEGAIDSLLLHDLLGDPFGTYRGDKDSYWFFGEKPTALYKHCHYDLRLGRVTMRKIDALGVDNGEKVVQTKEFTELTTQIKFLDGWVKGYSKEEEACLKQWLAKNNPVEMKKFFTDTILKHRPEVHFKHSFLYNLIEELIAAVPA